ncbi:MAG: hypothetical protein JST66_09045 [Bacteroidetes bacterium]|nr:hypothetical protein [Bacteroidota bacterium]
MKRERVSGRSIMVAIALLILAAMALVVHGLMRTNEHTIGLGTLTLDRVMDAQRTRLETVLGIFEADLEQEAAYVREHDTLPDEELVARWRPLMIADPSINCISLADERGNERSLCVDNGRWSFGTTVSRSQKGPPAVTDLNGAPGHPPITHIADTLSDPREEVWFSQALEGRHGDPVWSSGPDSALAGARMHVSLLVRGRTSTDAYHILRLTVSSERMMKGLSTSTPAYSSMPLSAAGRPYIVLDTSAMGRAWQVALRTWGQRRRTHTAFTFTSGGSHYIGQVVPYGLKGAALAVGTLIELGPFERWTDGERRVLVIGGGLLVLLAFLLLWAYVRARRRDARVRKQEKYSRTQERKLAKALGEREILDREVHHRVKNNLQVVSSLLNLQMQRITDANARSEFVRGKRRIDSMALVHHKLYRQYDLRAIDLNVLLTDLAQATSAMYEPQSRSVSYSVDTAGIRGDADTSIQLGMILCELLANCYQHAFPYATGGHIEIGLRQVESDLYRLSVKDNGRGLDASMARVEQLGLEIVEALAEQLDGSMSARNAEGTVVDVLFRMQRIP